MRHRLLLAAAFLYLAVANLIWIARDTRPPFWDMAGHQLVALRIYDAFATTGLNAFTAIPHLTGFYPPFYHSIVAVFYAVFGRTIDAAQWANLPAIAILLLTTYGIGRRVLSPIAAATAAAMVNFFPILLWLSRETMIDYWLTSMVTLTMWLLLRTEEFSKRGQSVGLGVVCGLGMLTKHTFPLFIVLPFLWLARKNPRNAIIAALVAGGLAATWYVPSAAALLQFVKQNAAGGSVEGDPPRLSLLAVVFYIRALEGYQLFLPLFVLFVIAIAIVGRSFKPEWIPIVLWVTGGWLGLMIFQNKDPRYSAPLLPAVAIITAVIFDRKRALIGIVLPLLLFQHYLVSFGIRSLPATIVVARGVDGPLPWNWNLYTQTYFDLWGRPAREDWQIGKVLDRVSAQDNLPVRIGLIPDIPRFDGAAFEFYISLWKLPITINRLGVLDPSTIEDNDYILLSERGQGFAELFSPDILNINNYVLNHPDSFRVVELYALPNGEVIRLYKVV